MASEMLTSCPFCKNNSIKVIHIPFVANTTTSKCRAGGRNTRITEEKYDIISGCEKCGKTQKEVEKAMNEGEEVPHEERIKRIRESGLPTQIEF